MISDESYELIGILLGAAMNSAADDQRTEYYERCSRARYEFVTMMDREAIPARNSDRALVDEAIERHAVEMLKLSAQRSSSCSSGSGFSVIELPEMPEQPAPVYTGMIAFATDGS